jgi:hypothetical protein
MVVLRGLPRTSFTSSVQIAKAANYLMQANEPIVPLPVAPIDPLQPLQFATQPLAWPPGGILKENLGSIDTRQADALIAEYGLRGPAERDRDLPSKRRRLSKHLNV